MRGELLWKNTSIPQNSLAVGVWVAHREFKDLEIYFAQDVTIPFEAAWVNWWDLSLFVEDVYQISDSVVVSGGVRLGYTILGHPDLSHLWQEFRTQGVGEAGVDVDTFSVSPRLALSWSITEQTILKISYGRAFRLPDAAYLGHQALNNFVFLTGRELDYVGDEVGQSYIHLSPELIDSIEINSINTFWEDHLSLNLSLYGNMYSDTLVWNGYTFVNVPDVYYSVGGEIAIASSIPVGFKDNDQIYLSSSYGYSRPMGFNAGAYKFAWEFGEWDFA